MKYLIKYSTNPPSKIFEVNDLEEQFFNILYSKLSNDINTKIYLIRLSDGTLNVEYKNGLYIGKIKGIKFIINNYEYIKDKKLSVFMVGMREFDEDYINSILEDNIPNNDDYHNEYIE